MRMQSPASSGLLPASYSRRRRNRPNESSVTDGNNSTNNTGGAVAVVSSASYYNNDHHGNNDPEMGGSANNVGGGGGISPRRIPSSRKPLYTLASAGDSSSKTSDSENEENDPRRCRTDHNARNKECAYEEGYEDVLDKPAKLSDFVINDRCYQRYLQEGKRESYRGIGPGKHNSTNSSSSGGFMDPAFLAKLCAGCSFVGMLFLIFVAIIMETQPLFIKGVSVKSTSNHGDDGTYRFRRETSNALKAAAAYFLTMVFSLIYLQTKDMNLELNPAIGRICHLRRLLVSSYFRYRRRHYDDIPDGHGSLFGGGGGSGGSILPMHNRKDGEDSRSRRRKKKKSRRKDEEGSSAGGGGTMDGVMGKLKSWGIGGGSSRSGRKKDR